MGMMECKKALTEAAGDAVKATELLREWAGGKMDTRSDREAEEGVIAIGTNDAGDAVAIVFVTAESDFAAKNDGFVANTQQVADLAAKTLSGTGDVTDHATDEMKTLVEDLRLTIKENIQLKAVHRFAGEKIGSYVHTNRKLGAVVTGTGDLDDDLLKGLAMHVVSAVPPLAPHPIAIDKDGLPAEAAEAAKAQFVEEAAATGKPQEIAEKIAMGKMNKWQDEHTLLGQTYIREMDAKKPVRDYLPKDAAITGFIRLAVGD
jgi:elongation factor Ts